jgi:hypothetical protein
VGVVMIFIAHLRPRENLALAPIATGTGVLAIMIR